MDTFTGRRIQPYSQQFKDQIIKYTKRKMLAEYVYWSFKDMINYESTGIIIQVGSDENKIIVKVHPFVTSILLDTVGRSSFTGISFQQTNDSPCSTCRQKECYDLSIWNTIKYRKDKYHINIGTLLENGFIMEAISRQKLSLNKKYYLNDTLKKLRFEAKKENIPIGSNIAMLLFSGQNDVLKIHNGFFKSLRIDQLHCWLLGCLKNMLTLVASIVKAVGKMDNRNYGSNMEILDRRIKYFWYSYTLSIDDHERFSKGFSPYIRNDNSNNAIYGGLEGHYFGNLLFQVMIVIDEESILPSDTQWFIKYYPKDKTFYGKPLNVMKNVVTALAAAIELHFNIIIVFIINLFIFYIIIIIIVLNSTHET